MKIYNTSSAVSQGPGAQAFRECAIAHSRRIGAFPADAMFGDSSRLTLVVRAMRCTRLCCDDLRHRRRRSMACFASDQRANSLPQPRCLLH